MPDLIAQGAEPQDRWRRNLPVGRTIAVGRTSLWATPWDDHISRQHAEICWRDGRLHVEKAAAARNPLFFAGREVEHCSLQPGQHFVIGGTTFTVTDERAQATLDAPRPVTEQTYSPQYLKRHNFRNADRRITVLSRLPEIVSGAGSDTELYVQLVNVLLIGIPRASAVAVVALREGEPGESAIEVLHWDRRMLLNVDFQPSERLIRQAVQSGESVVHLWSGQGERESATITLSKGTDWAFAAPVTGDACRGWAIYVTGGFSGGAGPSAAQPTDTDDLRDDLKFAELAATTLGNLRDVRALERSQSSWRQFFSPVVLDALSGQDPEVVLQPREAEVSVLFCDLRGFSRRSEQLADDLMGLLNRVSRALGVTTHQILQEGGVVGDFHGDAAMGFWGWPLAQQEAPSRACQAALGIRAELEAAAGQDDHPLADFRLGIGIATGRAVAGKIGTTDQVKVTVFGPVVNLASRLETMTKLLRAPILIDEVTAQAVRRFTSRDEARIRRVAHVLPYGMQKPLEVSELLPPEPAYPQMSDEHIKKYEAALDALLRDWDEAFALLHHVPAEDRVKDFLTVFIAQHNRTPPENWDGVIPLSQK